MAQGKRSNSLQSALLVYGCGVRASRAVTWDLRQWELRLLAAIFALGAVTLSTAAAAAQGDAGPNEAASAVDARPSQPAAEPELQDVRADAPPPSEDDLVGDSVQIDADLETAPDDFPAETEEEGNAGRTEETGGSQSGESFRIRYLLESVEILGLLSTQPGVVRDFVPLSHGDVLDIDSPELESIRWRLLGTGWFSDVRLRIKRGHQRGWVVLVLEVQERNTLVIQSLTVGAAESVATTTADARLEPYAGIAVIDSNLFGTGMSISVAGVASRLQGAGRLRFTDPGFLGSNFDLSVVGSYHHARDFFGTDVLVDFTCPAPPDDIVDCPTDQAIVVYDRYGFGFGTGDDLSATVHYSLDWQGDIVDVAAMPNAASERRGSEIEPIDFSIEDGVSFVSTLRFGLTYDRRDDPGMTSRGTLLQLHADAGTALLGSAYNFLRLDAQARFWVPLPWGHTFRVGLLVGAVFGEAPFFYQFYASDLSDLIPSRVLELNMDRRPPPNLLNNSIAEMRNQELAGRIDVEYSARLYSGRHGLRALDAYGIFGAYSLADIRDIRTAIPGYRGISAFPVDLTFDVGIRADTDIGVFQLGFSTIFNFFSPFDP